MHEHNQLSRFTVNDANPLQPVFTNEAPILDWNDLSSAQNHNGGAIHFGADGMLYADAGDNVQTFTGPDDKTYRVSQSLNYLLGKQLRIDVSKFNSGTATRDDTTVGHLIPDDNPFVGTASGIYQLIYALGLRNPFTFAVQPNTGRILINDVGENTWEEIDDSLAGGNYGWSGGNTDGFGNPPPAFAAGTYHDPLLAYAHSGTASLATGIAIVGGTFYDPTTVQFPSSYVGMYFYEDLSSGWIRYFNPNTPNNAATPDGNSVAFASNTPGGLRDLKVDSSGSLYYLSGGDGSIRKISFTGNTAHVAAEHLFYSGSAWDVTNGSTFSDDNAIATDKTAYVANGAATTFASVSSYNQGLNGVMIDISGLPGTISASDFIFKSGNNNSPSTWTTTTAPQTITTRAGKGSGGSDRVELIWNSGTAVKAKWLEVIVKGHDALGSFDTNTGLSGSSVFFFGSAPGDTGDFLTNSSDGAYVLAHPHDVKNPATITDVGDFNRDKSINSSDGAIVLANPTNAKTGLVHLELATGGPFAPAALPTDENDAIATALAAGDSARPGAASSGPPPWLMALATDRAVSNGSADRYFLQLETRITARAASDSEAPDDSEDARTPDDSLVDALFDPWDGA
jgi:hypothetical protein